MALIRQFSKAPAKVIPLDVTPKGPLFVAPPLDISTLDTGVWQGPGQPVRPIAPAGTEPRGLLYAPGQNYITQPRPQERFTFEDLRSFATYPLVNFIISSLTDQLCDQAWQVRVKPQPGETNKQRLQREANDDASAMLTNLFQFPNPDCTWRDFLKMWLEDVFVIDAPALLLRRNKKGDVAQIRAIDGAMIVRLIDENGWTPQNGDPAYSQLWFGESAVHLTTDQLIYRPRNVRTHKLYGNSPVEKALKLIMIGQKRLDLFDNFYTDGSIPDGIQVVPAGTTPQQIREQQEWMTSTLAGNLARRVQLRLLQGFETGNKQDQFLFPKEKALTDETDDFLIRVLCYAFGVSPQRLMKMNNRSTANASQDASEEEGREPIKSYVADTLNLIIQKKMGYKNHEFTWQDHRETDVLKQAQADEIYVKCGVNTINEIRENKGDDPSENPVANELVVITPQGGVVLGQAPPVPPGQGGGDGPAKPAKPAKEPNAMGDGKGGHDTSKALLDHLTENMAELRRMVGSVHERVENLGKYSDDQPRDESGKWTSEGGGVVADEEQKNAWNSGAGDPGGHAYIHLGEPVIQGNQLTPRPLPGQEHEGEVGANQSVAFASPNQQENLTFKEAETNLNSQEHENLHNLAVKSIAYGSGGGTVHDAIGDWHDGAENSLIMVGNTSNPEDIQYSAAVVGRAGNQKGIITFSPKEGGADAMHTFTTPHSMASVRSGLSKVGIESRTLEPLSTGGVKVYVYDEGGKMAGTMKAASEHFGAGITTTRGVGAYIGGNTREEGRAAFNRVIGKYEHEHPERAIKSVQRPVLHRQHEGNGGQEHRDRRRSASKVACALCDAEVPRVDGDHVTVFGDVVKCLKPVVKKKSKILSY